MNLGVPYRLVPKLCLGTTVRETPFRISGTVRPHADGKHEDLLNDDLFKKAVKAALQAKKDQEQKYKDNPKYIGSTPAQAARVKFLEVLKNENTDDKPKDDKEKK